MSLSQTYHPNATANGFIVRAMAICCTTLIWHTSVFAQPLQKFDSLPPAQWRSAARPAQSETATSLMPVPAGNRLRPVTPVVSQQYSEAPTDASGKLAEPSLRAQLQRQKQLKIQEISRRLQQVLQVGPHCETANSQPPLTSDNVFNSGTSPFLPPIPGPDDGSSPTARTMPEQVNSEGMKDGSRPVDGVPLPTERLPLLPEIGVTKPVVDASAKPEADTTSPPDTVSPATDPPATDPPATDPPAGKTADIEPNKLNETNEPGNTTTDANNDQTPDSAEESATPQPSPGMPEISKMIDSLIQEEKGANPAAGEEAIEAPMSATTVLDTPVDRLRLSDSLFATKEFSLALQMYESLEAKDLVESERFWVTYQKASCLRRLNAIGEAQGIYRQLAGDANAGWLAGLSRWWLDRITDRIELQTEVDKVASILNAVQEVKDAGTTE